MKDVYPSSFRLKTSIALYDKVLRITHLGVLTNIPTSYVHLLKKVA